MTVIHEPHHVERPGDGRPASLPVGREAEVDRIRAFPAAARTTRRALLVTGDPGVGKTQILDAAPKRSINDGTRVVHAAGIQVEAEMSFSGLSQVRLPLLDLLTVLAAVHRDAPNVALGYGDGVPLSRLVVSKAALVLLREATTALAPSRRHGRR